MKMMLITAMLIGGSAFAKEDCFIVKEKNKILKQAGECKTPYTPQSSFKIALSLMGYDSGLLKDRTHPTFPFKKEYAPGINVCKGPHNPYMWMRDSCVWFSQVLTQKMGMKKFKEYVLKLKYGNQDVSGDKGKDNGLTNAWLASSLLISPEQQVEFIQKMLNQELPVSQKSFEMTKEILFIQELSGGWKLFGKTGNGRYRDGLQHGWFVGWIEKNNRSIVFVHHIADEVKRDTFASFRSKNKALIKLWYLIDELEK